MSSGEVEEKVFEILSLSGEVLCTVESLSTKKRTSFALYIIYFIFYVATSGILQLVGLGPTLRSWKDRALEKLTAKGTKGG